MTEQPVSKSELFDQEFEHAANSPWLRAAFGADLPPDVEPFSFVTLDGLELFARELGLRPGDAMVDLGCGPGGPGLWLARASGARLIGVDFSRTGLRYAVERAERQLPAGRAAYVLADAGAIALRDGCVKAVVCIDAIQLMGDSTAIAAEIHRVLCVGGRAGFTTWEHDDRFPDLGAILESAQLTVLLHQQRDDWLAREMRIFEQARAEAGTMDDAGLADLAEEAERALPILARSRRLIVVAERRG